jgi:hypothetical protein
MIAILEALVLAALLLSVVHLLVTLYARSVHRERLEKEWDAGGVPGDRDDYVARGMTAYEHSLRRRMIVLVYVVPVVAVVTIIFLINRN